MNIVFPIVCAVLALTGGIALLLVHDSRARSQLADWASRNGLRLMEIEARVLQKGPFAFTASPLQYVYRIVARDASGQTMEGWARCGGWLFGLMEEAVEVRWDHP